MDPITARALLRIDPAAPLTVDRIETAAAQASWASHPSRFPEGPARQEAERLTGAIAAARATLLAELANPRRTRLSGGAIAGIVVASVLTLLIGVGAVAIAVIGGAAVTRAIEASELRGDSGDGAGASAPPAEGDVDADRGSAQGTDDYLERFEADETGFRFDASVEFYDDGRYDDECPADLELGCWEAALFTDKDCASNMSVQVGYANDEEQVEPDVTETLRFDEVVAGEPVPVVYGNDDYEFGWIFEVICHDNMA